MSRKPAFVFDLDATINHSAPAEGGEPIRGRTMDSHLAPATLERLALLAQRLDLFVATGRSAATVGDFERAFQRWNIPVAGWILEHGAVVRDHPDWTDQVLQGIDLPAIFQGVQDIIAQRELPIDCQRYRDDHAAFILLSGQGPVLAEHLIDLASELLGDRFRSTVGRRKIALIPRRADKQAAFERCFGQSHALAFAAGDDDDDLSLLQQAAFPLAPAAAADTVRDYVLARGGFVASEQAHQGSAQLLDVVIERLERGLPGLEIPGPRLPRELSEDFRPSRRAYLDLLFQHSPLPTSAPDAELLQRLAQCLDRGRGLVIEARLRDWGGEAKSLEALLAAITPLLPWARWRLVFRPERLGVENLKRFHAISQRLPAYAQLPDGVARLSAPGVPESPADPGAAQATLLIYDHRDDMEPWYDLAMPRLVTRHPQRPHTWFASPMHLKLAGARGAAQGRVPRIHLAGLRTMMAANLVWETDIRVAVEGFRGLRDAGEVEALVIAPRVVNNPERNRMIEQALREIGEEPVRYSQLQSGQRPRVLWVDVYGVLADLYSYCELTWLGGGFDPRKRGFDPMESLVAGVPVITGPIRDNNRIAVDGLLSSGWVRQLRRADRAPAEFARQARMLLFEPPHEVTLRAFLAQRDLDPLRVAAELLADLTGESGDGYLLAENRDYARDKLTLGELI